MNYDKLWNPLTLGRMSLPHRLVMAPMTRSRANTDGTTGDLAATYYSQRAGMGLIISEGTQPSLTGQGYLNTPGIYNEQHIEAWKRVIDAVHAKGGYFFIQLMHAGRMNHPDNTPDHHLGVAPSAIAPGTKIFTAKGMQEIPVPLELSREDIKQTIEDYARAARAAVAAGADGVEIHGANGYLIHQFLGDNANYRTDKYGGSIENKARFGLEVVDAVIGEIGARRTALRLSPYTPATTVDEGEITPELYHYLIRQLNEQELVYLHIMHTGNEAMLGDIRQLWHHPLIVNRAGRPLDQLAADVDSGIAELAAVGTWALANPDLPSRLQKGAPLNDPDPSTFYGGGAHGYIDYPAMTK